MPRGSRVQTSKPPKSKRDPAVPLKVTVSSRSEVYEQLTQNESTIEPIESMHPSVIAHVLKICWSTGKATGVYVRLRLKTGGEIPCVLTCAHVLSSERRAMDAIVTYMKGNSLRLNPSRLFLVNKNDDISVCALERAPTPSYAWSIDRNVSFGKVTLLHFPMGGQLSVSNGGIVSSEGHTLVHDAHTLPGSSGAPIARYVKGRWILLGIHCQAVNLRVGTRSIPLNTGTSLAALDETLTSHGITWVSVQRTRGGKRARSKRSTK